MTNKSQSKIILLEVVNIRIALIVLLVLYHSFAPYCGGWKPIEGQELLNQYWWIGKASYAFLLESFVFISGYVLGFQYNNRGIEILSLKKIISGKVKRLIIPCVLFSLVYLLIFEDLKQPIFVTIYRLFCGVGHMWFLPMLFWCFVLISIIEKCNLNKKIIIPFAIVLSVLPLPSMPFRFDGTLHYFSFFYVGYLIFRDSINVTKFLNKKSLFTSVVFFVITFVFFTQIFDKPDVSEEKIEVAPGSMWR